jgi:hypothetical protein
MLGDKTAGDFQCQKKINPFTAEVAIMRLLGSAPVAFVQPEKEEQSDWLV